MKEEHPASIRVLRTALQRKERMEKWLAAHTHEAVPAPDWRSDVEMAERTQVHLGLGPRDAFE
ncbi:MAG: hypothetical protein ABI759_28295 [Candidatus Solibacter sp.]